MVVNTADGSPVGTIPDTPGVHGVALAPSLGKGFSSNGRGDDVTVFDLQTLKPLETIGVKGQNPDVILFEKASGRLLTFNGLTVEYKINLLAPAKGERFAFRSRVVKAGRTITVCEGQALAIGPRGEVPVATMICTLIAVVNRDHVQH